MRLKDRIAVVTGGARGIGLGIVRRLAQEGALTVIGDVRADLAQQQAAALKDEGLHVEARLLDVTSSASVDQFFSGVVADLGRLDILVNNAGVHLVKPITEYTDDDWAFVMNINARGPFFTLRAAARYMKQQRYGRIVNIVTILTGTPYSSLYEASKHSLMGLTKCLMYELAPYGITVNAISPGAVDTELLRKGIHEKAQSAGVEDQFIWDQIAQTTPLGRICTPEDVAAAVAFFASSDADYITGELIHVTGGTFHQNLGRR